MGNADVYVYECEKAKYFCGWIYTKSEILFTNKAKENMIFFVHNCK
jgi:hypothetical protein